MQGFAFAGGAVWAVLFVLAGTSGALAQGNPSPNDRAGRLIADMRDCKLDKQTSDVVTRKLTDWVRHTQRNDNALTCTRDPKCNGLTVEMTMGYLCARVPCDKGPPPAAPPDCSTFIPRLKAMRLLRDDWQPRDGLK